MATRIFAVIIGIDTYKSRTVQNLRSCTSDAKKIKQWLLNDLSVPKEHIRLLLGSEATKSEVEDTIMEHLVNNPDIEHGDAIFIYFAGNGSRLSAPADWFQDGKPDGFVDILCTYDHDTKSSSGQMVGISDRSMHALLHQLADVKGDNITFVLDCCFSPPLSRINNHRVRWTPTLHATPDDLYRGLWSAARGNPYARGSGFCEFQPKTHVLLAACDQGGKAIESKSGGNFTSAFLKIASDEALHRTSYVYLHDLLGQETKGMQMPICNGLNKRKIIFDAVPFVADGQFVPAEFDDMNQLCIGAGAVHGITIGSEFTLHLHNYRGSKNPSLANIRVVEMYSTWCIGELQSDTISVPTKTWARISRWNNLIPYRVKLKATFTALLRYLKLRRSLPTKANSGQSSLCGFNIIRVNDKSHADMSLKIGRHDIVVDRHDQLLTTTCRPTIRIERKSGMDVINDAARFHLHLHSENPEHPLTDLVKMELYSLDPLTWRRREPNLLVDGKATIHCDQSAIFTAVIRNKSDHDLWPYLFFMDSNCYGITVLYHPDPTLSSPPLSRHSTLHVGSGKPGSEALSFALADRNLDSGFLKLFLTSSAVPMNMIEKGPSEEWAHSAKYLEVFTHSSSDNDDIWDTSLACLSFMKDIMY
ncbi:hypothetical protein APHAL10511_003755 [Amanita phalloides]|nr:hypothetical protein APHAL10511_003755 [Amanita phalloides]